MRFKEVSYSAAETVSKDYQSYKIHVGCTVEVDNGTPGIALAAAKVFVNKKLSESIERIKERI